MVDIFASAIAIFKDFVSAALVSLLLNRKYKASFRGG